jgi:hypothetical protein
MLNGSRHRPHVIYTPHQNSSTLQKHRIKTPSQVGWWSTVFSTAAVFNTYTRGQISIRFLLVSQSPSHEAEGCAQVNQTILVPCSHNHVCFHSWIHNQFHQFEICMTTHNQIHLKICCWKMRELDKNLSPNSLEVADANHDAINFHWLNS